MHRRHIAASLFSAPFIAGLLMVLHACGGSGGSNGGGQQPGTVPLSNFSGRFQGTEQGTQGGVPFQAPLTMTLSQNGNQVSGDWAATTVGTGAGPLSGTVTGNSLTFTATENATGCTSSGTGTLNGNELTGKWTVTSPNCPAGEVTFDLFRQGAPSPAPTVTVPAPPADCNALRDAIFARAQSLRPDDSGFCNADSECQDWAPGPGGCSVPCWAATVSIGEAWRNTVESDPQELSLCQQAHSISGCRWGIACGPWFCGADHACHNGRRPSPTPTPSRRP